MELNVFSGKILEYKCNLSTRGIGKKLEWILSFRDMYSNKKFCGEFLNLFDSGLLVKRLDTILFRGLIDGTMKVVNDVMSDFNPFTAGIDDIKLDYNTIIITDDQPFYPSGVIAVVFSAQCWGIPKRRLDRYSIFLNVAVCIDNKGKALRVSHGPSVSDCMHRMLSSLNENDWITRPYR